MKIILKWQQNKDVPIVACAVDPVHDQLVVGVGKVIILYDVVTGNEQKRCEKHTQDITCLAFRKDGLWFASGSKDNLVYIWDISNFSKPTNKITFPDSLIHLAYNPCIFTLLAISKTTLAVYRESGSRGGTNKVNLGNTAVDIAWTSDGLRFALGYENGTLSIKDKDMEKEEKSINLSETHIEKIICICFSATRFLNKDYALYVGTWDKNIYIIELFNNSFTDVKKLNSDPICITLFKDDYFMVGTNSNEVNFYTKEGTIVASITEGITDWVMSIKPSHKYSSIVACTNDGKILNHQITFQIVHGIYNDKYVYRQNLMEVVIHDLMTGVKNKIKCKKYIRKLAVYKDLVAALTADKVLVYQISDEESAKSPKFYIKWEGDINLILMTSSNLLVCFENHLYMYPLSNDVAVINTMEREWSFESDIKYLRVLGGAIKREALICGLKNGEIYMIYVDNQFPVLIFQHDIPIRSLDVNNSRKKLAIVDENFDLTVVDLLNRTILWKNEKAKSLAFNSELDNMLSYWYEGNVFIKTSDFPPISEKMSGVIIGFKGTKVFILQSMNTVNVLDISHSTSIMKYSERKEFAESYKVACLGATNQEWLYLGFEALLNFDFLVAVNCFKKLQDIRLINLVFTIEQQKKEQVSDDILRGDILAYMGRYKESADAYIKGGAPSKAQEMYATLKMYAEALEIKNKYLQGKEDTFTDTILYGQAEWLFENAKFKEAADLFWALNKKKRAIEIYGDKGMLENLIEICRGFNKEDSSDLIALCGYYFKKHQHYQYATEAYLKLGDLKALVYMNVDLKKWDDAFILSQQSKQLLEYVYLQYAEYLITLDKFREAQQAYKKAERMDLSMKLLDKLIDNAVYEKRYKDACYLFINYANDALTVIKDFQAEPNKNDQAKMKDYKDAVDLADIFNAYDCVYKYIEEPFSSDLLAIDNNGLFNACRFLVNKITNFKTNNKQIRGISPAYVYYSLAFLSKQLEAFKTARFSFEKLSTLKFPAQWQSKIDFEIMGIRTKPYTDKDTNLPLCFRCLHTNPLINVKGDHCNVCVNPFIRSPISYEILPLIEFRPASSISDDKAIEIIKTNTMAKLKNCTPNVLDQHEGMKKGVNTLIFDQSEPQNEDLFGMKLVEICENQGSTDNYTMFEIDETILRSLNESEVFIIDNRDYCKTAPVRFFKNRMKDIFITLCKFCHRFFRTEEFENLFLKYEKACPICRESDEALKKYSDRK